MPSKTVDELCQAIEAAFAEAEYPGDENIVRNGTREDIESKEVRDSFTGRHWKTVPPGILLFNRDNLRFFTPKAFRFFLPAVLIAVLKHPVEVDVLSDNIVNILTPGDPNGAINYGFFERINGLTPAQKGVVRKFINWYLDEFITQEWKTLVPNPAWERVSRFWNNA